jgi:hypothetical protein
MGRFDAGNMSVGAGRGVACPAGRNFQEDDQRRND